MQRLQRRKDPGPELEETLRCTQVLQPVQSEIANIGTGEIRGGLRQQHLAAVRSGCDPCSTMDVDADVFLGLRERLASVDPHPNTHRPVRKRALRIGGGSNGLGRSSERNEERVTRRIDLDPAMPRPNDPQHAVVLGEHLGDSRHRVPAAAASTPRCP